MERLKGAREMRLGGLVDMTGTAGSTEWKPTRPGMCQDGGKAGVWMRKQGYIYGPGGFYYLVFHIFGSVILT